MTTLTLDPEQSEVLWDALMAHAAGIANKLGQARIGSAADLRRERQVTLKLMADVRRSDRLAHLATCNGDD